MKELFQTDPLSAGSKGLVFVGEKILVYRRDDHTGLHPNELDLPGGGPMPGETPFETFSREVKEEFGLVIEPTDVCYARRYPSSLEPGKFGWFVVAKLSSLDRDQIQFGDEGSQYWLMKIEDYLSRDDAWMVFQQRTKDYVDWSRSYDS